MSRLTHIDETGAARMVSIGGKSPTSRSATAEGRIHMVADALAALADASGPKGDAIAAARIAGIMAAKRASELIPLCHPLSLESVRIDFDRDDTSIRVTATAAITGKTGVEMEALTAVSVALLTLYDMAKALDKGMRIEGIRLLKKSGGKNGPRQAGD